MVSGGTPTIGESYMLTCTVTGADEFNRIITYQWLKNNSVVPGEVQSVLTFSSLKLSDAGQYACGATVSLTFLRLSENITVMSGSTDINLQRKYVIKIILSHCINIFTVHLLLMTA